jgi:hypothetical protein
VRVPADFRRRIYEMPQIPELLLFWVLLVTKFSRHQAL